MSVKKYLNPRRPEPLGSSPPRPSPPDPSGDSVVLWALVSLSLLFVLCMTYGWGLMLTPIFPAFAINWVSGFFIAVVGIIMAKAVASERLTTQRAKHRGELGDKKLKGSPDIWYLYFFVLILISALGTMNLFFKAVYGAEIFDKAIIETRNGLLDIKTRYTFTDDKPSEWAELQKLVNSDRTNFRSELENRQNPGWGKGVDQSFKNLQALLPGLPTLNIRKGPMTMQKAMEVADQYDALIEQKLVERLSPELQQRKKDSNVVLKEIDQLIKSLDDRRTQGAFADSKTTLETLRIAWSFYDQKLAILNDDSLPPSIRSADAENVGRIEQIIPNLLRSADNPMTIVIVFFALFFDWALVQFFLRYLHETRPSETEITF